MPVRERLRRLRRRADHDSGRSRPVLRGALLVVVFALGGAAALLALGFGPPTRGEVGPGTVELRAEWDLDGRTKLHVPPLGAVTARTHVTPVDLEAGVAELDVDRLEQILRDGGSTEALYAEAESDLRSLLRTFAWRSLAAAAVVGAFVGGFVSRLRIRHVLAGALGGLLGVGVLLGMTWQDFDAEAFAQPTYHGPLERAPEVVEVAREHMADIDLVRERIAILAAQVSELYALANDGSVARDPDEVRVLHVSDIHSNPLGVEVTRRLATSFAVDAVLDTGDVTSFSHPLESRIGSAIAAVPGRYLFVPGNHDSAEVRAALDEVSNVELLDGDEVNVRGVTILGIADPTFTADNSISADRAAQIRLQHADRVERLARAHRPHVLAVHDPRLASESHGVVPVIAAGHRHRRSVSEHDGTIELVVGSTGATGLGSFATDDQIPFEAQLLRFVDGCLSAVDAITLDGIGGSFDIERRTFEREAVAGPLRCTAP